MASFSNIKGCYESDKRDRWEWLYLYNGFQGQSSPVWRADMPWLVHAKPASCSGPWQVGRKIALDSFEVCEGEAALRIGWGLLKQHTCYLALFCLLFSKCTKLHKSLKFDPLRYFPLSPAILANGLNKQSCLGFSLLGGLQDSRTGCCLVARSKGRKETENQDLSF